MKTFELLLKVIKWFKEKYFLIFWNSWLLERNYKNNIIFINNTIY